MRKLVLIPVIMLLGFTGAFAQIPKLFSYQAVIKGPGNTIIPNQLIGMKISIIRDSVAGTVVYEETHQKTTSASGVVNLVIGQGTVVSGTFNTIDWNQGPYFIKTDSDPTGGNSYVMTASSELLAVPYSLASVTADTTLNEADPLYKSSVAAAITAADTSKWSSFVKDTSTTNEIQHLLVVKDTIVLSKGGGFVVMKDTSSTNEIQNLSISNGTVSLSNGGSINLPDSTITNELQDLSIVNGTVSLTQSSASIKLPDSSITNEIQALSINNGTVSLNNGGGNITLPDSTSTNELQDLSIVNGTVSLTQSSASIKLPDSSITNEIQTLSINNGTVSLNNGGGNISLPDSSITNEIQTATLTGGTFNLSQNGGTFKLPDSSMTNEIQTISLSGSAVSLSQSGGSITLPDASSTNEIQSMSISNGTISLSNGGGSVSVPDSSITNEIQTISLSGSAVSLSQSGGSITLPDASSTNEIQVMSINNGTISLSNGGGSVSVPDSSITNELQVLSISNDTIYLSSGGFVVLPPSSGVSVSNTPVNGNLLSFDGTNWVAKNVVTGNTGSATSVNNMQPFLTLNFCFCLTGIYPSRNSQNPFIAEIMTFAGNFAPKNWTFCDGQLLSINSYPAAYSLVGTIYGGNGITTFGVPDLRGRTAIHEGQGSGLTNRTLGSRGGSQSNVLTISNLPAHNHTIVIQ